MKIGAALVLLAVGAILRFAIVTVSTHGVNVHTIGDILMVVGALGLILWLIVWAPWSRRRETTYPARQAYQDRPAYEAAPPLYDDRPQYTERAAGPDEPTRAYRHDQQY
jgi:hypothetical protein